MKPSTALMTVAIPPETSMTTGPKTSRMRADTTKISMSGPKIGRMTAGSTLLSQGSILEASQAPTMMGKIE